MLQFLVSLLIIFCVGFGASLALYVNSVPMQTKVGYYLTNSGWIMCMFGGFAVGVQIFKMVS